MWTPPLLRQLDPITRAAGAAVLCNVLAQCLSSPQSELFSEILCWIVLPVIFHAAPPADVHPPRGRTLPANAAPPPTSAVSCFVVAAGVASVCIFKAQMGLVVFLPALTPLFCIAQKYIKFEHYSSSGQGSRLFSFLATTMWGTALAAVFFILTLSDADLRGNALSIIPVVALLAVYITLTPRADCSLRFLPPLDMESSIVSLSAAVVLVLLFTLGVDTAAFNFPTFDMVAILASGLAKAFTWYFFVHTSQQSSWYAITAVGTFSILSTRDPFILSSDTQALSHVIGSFISLGQVIQILPAPSNSKSLLWIFSVIPALSFIISTFAIHRAQTFVIGSPTHPVEQAIYHARLDFDRLIEKQSQSYTAAHQEYQRRYGADPPPGFDAWYEFAKSHHSPIIDDFDTIYNAISPLWKLSGKDVLDLVNRVPTAPNSEVWLCQFSGREAKTHCGHPYRTFDRHFQLLFDTLMKDLAGTLPDVTFVINHLDEPRVLVPPSLHEGASPRAQDLHLANLSRRRTWEAMTKFCSSQAKSDNVPSTPSLETFGLPFVIDVKSAMDLCQHPEYSAMHGLAMGPASLRLIEGAVPVLSSGAPSTMGDILYPSAAYMEAEFQYDDAHDMAWESKRNNLYWAGSTTGGYVSDGQWPQYHRQRFVQLSQNLEKGPHSYLHHNGGMIDRVQSSFLNRRLFDVAFTRIFQCEWKRCRDQQAYFHLKPWENKDRALGSRLVFDLDGNGISGRYYKLLASRSAPLKQTLLREWHDDRLVPWVHYIPVSHSMEELPELVMYLTSTEAGQQRAREIADQGREWFSRAFREVDLTIYVYRLLLELARLQDPRRPAASDVAANSK